MKVIANSSKYSTVQLMEIELCKEYLNSLLRCKDNDSICCLAKVYLAVLYYITKKITRWRQIIVNC